jgi:beta-lactamase class A
MPSIKKRRNIKILVFNRVEILSMCILTIVGVILAYLYFSNYALNSISNKNLETSTLLNSYIPKKTNPAEKLQYLNSYLHDQAGTYSLYIRFMDKYSSYDYNSKEQMYGASLYKLPVAVAALKYIQDGKMTFNDKIMYLSRDFAEGTGNINTFKYGTEFTIDEVLQALLKKSDNSGLNMLLRILPKDYIEKSFKLMDPVKKYSNFEENNQTSAYMYSSYIDIIYNGSYLNDSMRDYLFNTMKETDFDDRISKNLNRNFVFSYKIGSWGDDLNWHDCGIIFERNETSKPKAIVCLMSRRASYDEFIQVADTISGLLNELL